MDDVRGKGQKVVTHHMDDVRGREGQAMPIIWMMLEERRRRLSHHMDDVRGSMRKALPSYG